MKKVALLFGNNDYQSSPLKDAVNDAVALSRQLENLGFICACYTNRPILDMDNMLSDFKVTLQGAEVALFFFAGHGVQCKNENFLCATDTSFFDENSCRRTSLVIENNRFVLNQRVALLRTNSTANLQFLFSYINSHQQYFKLQGAGMSPLNISKSSVENFTSFVPHIEEQTAIGNFFRNLDEQITAQQNKWDKLKQLKAAYLQKMFV